MILQTPSTSGNNQIGPSICLPIHEQIDYEQPFNPPSNLTQTPFSNRTYSINTVSPIYIDTPVINIKF